LSLGDGAAEVVNFIHPFGGANVVKLYMHPFSQHCRRVLMLCHELDLSIDTELVDLAKGDHKSPDYVAISVTGVVPLLQDDGFRLPESHAIMKYLVLKTGNYRFYPVEPRERAWVDAWLDWNHASLNPPIQALVVESFKGPKADNGLIELSRGTTERALDVLERGIGQSKQLGSILTLADFSLASTLALYEMSGANLTARANVAKWYDAMRTRESFIATAPKMS
jgi:glutathione S-transferase